MSAPVEFAKVEDVIAEVKAKMQVLEFDLEALWLPNEIGWYSANTDLISCRTILRALESYERNARDAERMDFIINKRATVYASFGKHEVQHWVFVDETARSRTGVVKKTLREAIDDALASRSTT